MIVRAALAAIVVAFAGCGGEQLTDDESLTVQTARVAVAQRLGPEAVEGVDRVLKIYRAKPDADYDSEGDALTMREVVEDMASDLEENQPQLASKLDRALNR